jgi:hypothetical protein
MDFFRSLRSGFRLTLVVIALAGTTATRAAEDKTLKKLYPKILKTSVFVVHPQGLADPGKINFSCGTGWVVDAKMRLVVTNYHVVRKE